MRIFPHWMTKNGGRLGDLAVLIAAVGFSLAILIGVFGTATHHPSRPPAWKTMRHVSVLHKIDGAWGGPDRWLGG